MRIALAFLALLGWHSSAAPALTTSIAQVSAKRELITGEKVPGEVLASPSGNAVLVVAPAERIHYWRGLAASLDKRERVETTTYAPRSFGVREVGRLVEQTIKDQPGTPADDRWRLVADELTGMLIITATPSQHEQVKALITRLDATPGAGQRPVRSFIIKNRPVKEIQSVLEQMVSTGVIGAASPDASRGTTGNSTPAPTGTAPWPPPASPAGSAPGPSVVSTSQPPFTSPSYPLPRSGSGRGDRDATVSFTSDDGTNTLIAMGEPRVLAQVESLLATLDVRQPQVMLEVLIVSLTADLYYGPAHNNLGVLYLKQAKLYEAAAEFEWARKLMPGLPDPRMNLALTLEKAGRTDEALAGYSSALDVHPDLVPPVHQDVVDVPQAPEVLHPPVDPRRPAHVVPVIDILNFWS